MTDLSPAAQAVLDAAFDPWQGTDTPASIAAAVLQAVADQVVPNLEEPDWGACAEMRCDVEVYTDHMRKRSQLLAIVAELKAK